MYRPLAELGRLTGFGWRSVLGLLVIISINTTPITLTAQEEAPTIEQRSMPRATASRRPQASQESNRIFGEIENIRKRLGGGVSEHLFDSKEGQAEANREFRNELQRLSESSERMPDRGTSPNQRVPDERDADQRFPDQSASDWVIESVPHDSTNFESATSRRAHQPVANSQMQVGLLREAARRLEEIAAEFESAGMYVQADSMRDKARQFWLQARNSRESERLSPTVRSHIEQTRPVPNTSRLAPQRTRREPVPSQGTGDWQITPPNKPFNGQP